MRDAIWWFCALGAALRCREQQRRTCASVLHDASKLVVCKAGKKGSQVCTGSAESRFRGMRTLLQRSTRVRQLATDARVAVVGGGLSGSLCALSLAARGVPCCVYDQGASGGRFGGSAQRERPELGAQFFRASSDRFRSLLGELEKRNLVGRWRVAPERFGLLGSHGGGFLPREAVPRGTMPTLATVGTAATSAASSRATATSGAPRTTLLVCAAIREMGGVELKPSGRVEAIERVEDGWRVEGKEFEAVVVASHGPSLAATAVAAAAAETADPAVVARLTGLVEAIARVRESRCAVVSAVVEVEGGEAIPFDAVTTPSSSVLQFLAREASKPGRADAGNAWTVVSTSSFADKRPGNDAVASLGLLLADEALRLLCPHGAKLTSALGAKMWRAAFSAETLEGWSRGAEHAVVLEPYRLAICGDFVRAAACPVEAAALSGLEAGDRVAAVLLGGGRQRVDLLCRWFGLLRTLGGGGVSRARSAAGRVAMRPLSRVGCAPPSTRRAIRSASSSASRPRARSSSVARRGAKSTWRIAW